MVDSNINFDYLHDTCTKLINYINQGKFNESNNIITYLNNYIDDKKYGKVTIDELTFYKVKWFLNLKCNHISFYDILKQLFDNNIHNSDSHVCNYHMESVLVHSVFAFLLSIQKITKLKKNISSNDKIKYCILSLFHDIGKKYTQTEIDKRNLGFPFHGESGAGILQQMFTEEIGELFDDRNDWDNFCRAIGTHMCGYHSTGYSDIKDKYKLDLLCFENDSVKEYLYWLSYTDKFAAFSKFKLDLEKYENFRPEFKKLVNQKLIFTNFLENYNINNGIIVQVNSSRKNIFPNKLIEQLKEKLNKNIILETYTIGKIDEKYTNYFRIIIDYLDNVKNINLINKNIEEETNKLINFITSWHKHFTNLRYETSASTKNKPEIWFNTSEIPHLRLQITDINNTNLLNWIEIINKVDFNIFKKNEVKVVQKKKEKMEFWDYIDQYKFLELNELLLELKEINNIEMYFSKISFKIKTPVSFQGINSNVKIVKYGEHVQVFTPWARDCRGTIFVYENNKVIFLKSLLQRGVEILTPVHFKNNITETENSVAKYLDNDQQKIIHSCLNQEDLPITVSFKLDGSLVGISFYKSNSYEADLIKSCINENIKKFSGDKKTNEIEKYLFAKCLIDYCEKINCQFIPVISSQNTLILPINMIDYFVTSIYCGCLKKDYNKLKEYAKIYTPLEIFEKECLTLFTTKLILLYNAVPMTLRNKTFCVSFESVVNNATSAWHNTQYDNNWNKDSTKYYSGYHSELAITINKSFFELIGITFNVGETTGNYRAHWQIKNIVEKSTFEEPVYWNISSTKVLNSMITDISLILKEKITDKEYYSKYIPTNIKKYNYIHYEGFVIYNKKEKSNSIGIEGEFDYDINYSKAKTTEYYMGHKYRKSNNDYLLSLPKSVDKYLPLVKKLRKFTISIREELIQITHLQKEFINDIIKNISTTNNLESIRKNSKFINSLTKKVKDNNLVTVYKMLINTLIEFKDFSANIIIKMFNLQHIPKDTIVKISKVISMNLEIWKDEDSIKILIDKNINECSDLIGTIYSIYN